MQWELQVEKVVFHVKFKKSKFSLQKNIFSLFNYFFHQYKLVSLNSFLYLLNFLFFLSFLSSPVSFFKLSQGYLPANAERRESVLQRKRQEYFGFIQQYYDSRNDEHHQDTYRQVYMHSSPHTNTLYFLFISWFLLHYFSPPTHLSESQNLKDRIRDGQQ